MISFRVGRGIHAGAGAGENGVQHVRGHPSGECVLLTWVITADEQHFARCLRIVQPDFGAVTEPRARPRQRKSALAELALRSRTRPVPIANAAPAETTIPAGSRGPDANVRYVRPALIYS